MTAEEGLNFSAVDLPGGATDKAMMGTFDSFASKSAAGICIDINSVCERIEMVVL